MALMSRAGDGFQRLARGSCGARWEPWEIVGWAVRDAEGLYLTSLRRRDRVGRQSILLREEPSRELRRHLRWSGFRVVRVVRRVRELGTDPLRASECWGYEPGTGLCYRSQGWERALGCAGLVGDSGAGTCQHGWRDWGWRWLVQAFPACSTGDRCCGW